MRNRQLLPALAGALAITLPATAALGAGDSPTSASAEGGTIAAPLAAGDLSAERARARVAHADAVDDVLRLSRRRARLGDSSAASRSSLRRWPTHALRRHERHLRASIRELRRTGGAPDVPIPAALAAIARCESGGDPGAVSSNGLYRGLFQFDRATWASVGGKGDPARASREEQYRRAAMLYARAGAAPWPVCGR